MRAFRSIFAKLLAIMALLTLPVFASLSYLLSVSSRRALVSVKAEDTELLFRRTGQYVDLMLEQIRTVLSAISARAEILSAPEAEVETLLRAQAIGELLLIKPDKSVVSGDRLLFDVVGHPKLTEFFAETLASPLGVHWSEPYYSPLQVGMAIAFCQAVRSPNGPPGVVVAEVDLRLVAERLVRLVSSRYQTFVILTAEGNSAAVDPESDLLAYEAGRYPPTLARSLNRALRALPLGSSRITIGGRRTPALKSRQTLLRWDFVMIVDEAFVTQPLRDLYAGLRGLTIMHLALLFAGIVLVGRHFSRPLRLLSSQMDRVQEEPIALPAVISRGDEIGRLSVRFRAMIERITGLLDRLRRNEAARHRLELALLQRQIQPHFLCNTLACVKELLRQNRVEEVERTLSDLVRLISTNVRSTDEPITFGLELEMLEAYVRIQRVRYGDLVDYRVSSRPEHAAVMIPPLLLQPIVENAIFHTLDARRQSVTVSLESELLEGAFHVFVRDNGPGMEPALAERISRLEGGEPLQTGSGGIGLVNVQRRLRLMYGGSHGLFITSRPSEGTQIEVCIPYPLPAAGRTQLR